MWEDLKKKLHDTIGIARYSSDAEAIEWVLTQMKEFEKVAQQRATESNIGVNS